MKINRFSRKPVGGQFYRFTENQAVKFEFFKILKIEIKKSKKTSVHFKIFGENKIQKFEETCPTKFSKMKNVGKIEKKLTGSL
jgi:hypothetical protein